MVDNILNMPAAFQNKLDAMPPEQKQVFEESGKA